MAITSPDQVPQLVEALKKERFYGELRLTFRSGHISRIVTEHSQVFDNPREGTQLNDNCRR